MSFASTLSAELRKAATLPAVWAGVAVTVLGSIALTLINASTTRNAVESGRPQLVADTSPFEAAFAMMPLGTVGAVVIGVVLIGSEYTSNSAEAGGGRQITATLAAMPRRVNVLAAKALTLVLAVLGTAAVALPASVAIAHAIIGDAGIDTVTLDDAVRRGLGGTLYWVLMGVIAFAITVMTRSAAIPLLVLVVNSSLVSIPLLLTNLTPLAHWLPDLAGRRLFDGPYTIDGGLDALPGAIVMGTWALLLLAIATVLFARRDA